MGESISIPGAPRNIEIRGPLLASQRTTIEKFFSRLNASPAGQAFLNYISNQRDINFNTSGPPSVSRLLIIQLESDKFLEKEKARGAYFPNSSLKYPGQIVISPESFNTSARLNSLGDPSTFEWTLLHEIGHWIQGGASKQTTGYRAGILALSETADALTSAYLAGKISADVYQYTTSPITSLRNTETEATEFANLLYKLIGDRPSSDFNYYLSAINPASNNRVGKFDYSTVLPNASVDDLKKLDALIARLRQPATYGSAETDAARNETFRRLKERGVAFISPVLFDRLTKILPVSNPKAYGPEAPNRLTEPPVVDNIYDANGNLVGLRFYKRDSTGKLVETGYGYYVFELDNTGKPVKDRLGVDKPPIKFVVSKVGVTSITSFRPGTTSVAGVDVIIPGNPLPFDFSTVGGVIGAQLGYRLVKGSAVGGVVASAALQSVGDAIGDVLDGIVSGGSVQEAVSRAFSGVLPEFLGNLQSAGLGAISSFITAELVKALGLEGFAGELTNSVGGAVIGQIVTNIATAIGGTPTNLFAGVGPQLILSTAASFLGSKLANAIYTPKSVGGQIGSAVGSAIGSIAASIDIAAFIASAGNPLFLVAAVIDKAIFQLIGSLIGSIFAAHPDPAPTRNGTLYHNVS